MCRLLMEESELRKRKTRKVGVGFFAVAVGKEWNDEVLFVTLYVS